MSFCVLVGGMPRKIKGLVVKLIADLFLSSSLEGESAVANQIGLDNSFDFLGFTGVNATMPVSTQNL